MVLPARARTIGAVCERGRLWISVSGRGRLQLLFAADKLAARPVFVSWRSDSRRLSARPDVLLARRGDPIQALLHRTYSFRAVFDHQVYFLWCCSDVGSASRAK